MEAVSWYSVHIALCVCSSSFSTDDIQGATGLEPFDLLLVVGMVYLYLVLTAIFVVQHHSQRLARGE